jgi:cholest-4-en-3-one 26-monooxygenase
MSLPDAAEPGVGCFDPFDASPDRDLTPAFARLRREQPVWEFQPNTFLLTRHADIREVLLDPATFSNHGNFFLGSAEASTEPRNITHLDPPEHTALRRVLLSGFSAGPIRDAEPWVRQRANELVDEFAADGAAELSRQYALALTTSIIARLVGLPAADADRVITWSHEIVQLRPAPVAEMDSFRLLFGYLRDLLDERRRAASPPDDMITRLMRRTGCPADRDRGDLELVTHVYQLMAAGFPTTAYTIEVALWQLLVRRERWEALSRDVSLLPAARDEALRFGSAIRSVFRTATRPTAVHDVTIPAGGRLVLSLESANRDEAVFDDPDTFRLDRDNTRHQIAFGSGIHLCVGAPLARAEIDAALGTLAARLPGLRLVPGFIPRWKQIGILNGLQEVPVEF